MAETPTSKSQSRAISLLGLTSDGTYMHAAAVLENAGCYKDGVPAGHTWRTAAKLSDADLLAGIQDPRGFASSAPVATTSEVRAARNAEWNARKDQRKADRREVDRLLAQGYRWVKFSDEDADEGYVSDDMVGWHLMPPAEKVEA